MAHHVGFEQNSDHGTTDVDNHIHALPTRAPDPMASYMSDSLAILRHESNYKCHTPGELCPQFAPLATFRPPDTHLPSRPLFLPPSQPSDNSPAKCAMSASPTRLLYSREHPLTPAGEVSAVQVLPALESSLLSKSYALSRRSLGQCESIPLCSSGQALLHAVLLSNHNGRRHHSSASSRLPSSVAMELRPQETMDTLATTRFAVDGSEA